MYVYIQASLVAHMVTNLPSMWETWVQFLGQEDPLEKRMATHSSMLVWRIPWTEDPSGSPWSHKESDTTEQEREREMCVHTRVRAHTCILLDLFFWRLTYISPD